MKYRFRPNENGEPDLDDWSKTAREWVEPYGLEPEFFEGVKEAEFKQSENGRDTWTDKPCFWLPKIESSEQFKALANKYPARRTEIVFCEDTRSFIKRSDARRFETALGRGIDIRYIKKFDDYDYAPLSQLAW